MNVLIVVPWDQKFGGVASVAGNLATYLSDSGHRVIFVFPGASDVAHAGKTEWGFRGYKMRLRPPTEAGSAFRSVLAFSLFLLPTLLQLAYVLLRHRIRVINVHFPSDEFVYFAFLRVLLPVKLVVSVHGTDLFPTGQKRENYSGALRLLLFFSDSVVAPSRTFLGDFLELFPKMRTKSGYIHNAIDLSEFAVHETRTKGGSPQTILCIASHNKKKALDVLLRAFSEVKERHPGLRLLLAGDGPLRPELEELARTLHVDSEVKFLGQQGREEIGKLLRECDLFVLPSRSEPFGIVIIEALACGKPVVASSVGGIVEIIRNGENGLLVPPDDPGALAEAINTVLSNPGLGSKMGTNGRATVVERFSVERNGNAYEQLFSSL